MKSHSILMVSIALIALLLLSGCLGFNLPAPKNTPPATTPPGTTPPGTTPPGTTPPGTPPAYNPVPPTTDLSAIYLTCNGKANQIATDDCFKSYAIQNTNPTLCRQLRQLSQDTCLDAVARKANNYVYCAEISAAQPDLKDGCLYTTAIAQKDSGGCLLISDQNKQKTCVSLVATSQQNVGACDQITVIKDRDTCIEQAAVKNKDYLLCNLVSVAFESAAGFRRDQCLTQVLQSVKDEKLCPYYLDKTQAYNCFDSIARSKNNAELCYKIPGSQQADACILFVNQTVLSSDLCFKINDSNLQQQCFITIQQNKPTTSICSQITDMVSRDACYKGSALDTNSAADCRNILDNTTRYVCYNTIAQSKLDELLCKQIPPLNPQFNDCIQKLAVNALTPSVCEDISEAAAYLNCYSGAAQAVSDYTICHQATRTNYAVTLIYSMSDLCIKQYGIIKNDSIACKNIVDDNVSQQCLTAIGAS